jgi:hypothetical protein
MSILTTLFNTALEDLASAIKARKSHKRPIDWKRIKPLLFEDNMIVYIENPKDSKTKTQLIPLRITEFSTSKVQDQNQYTKIHCFSTSKQQTKYGDNTI